MSYLINVLGRRPQVCGNAFIHLNMRRILITTKTVLLFPMETE